MISSTVLALREGLEAALIVGILIGVLKKMELNHLRPLIWAGVLSAALVSLVVAVILGWLGAEFVGRGEMIFEGVMLLSAALLLTWMILWMRAHSTAVRLKLEDRLHRTAAQKNRLALFLAAFTAVLREGVELAIFLLAVRFATSPLQTALGSALGLSIAVLLGWMLFTSTRRLNLGAFFKVTNIILLLFAAGMVARGVHEFNEAGLIPTVVERVYNINPYLPEGSTLGQLLSTLLGYSGSPSLTVMIAYILSLFGLGLAVIPRRRMAAAPIETGHS